MMNSQKKMPIFSSKFLKINYIFILRISRILLKNIIRPLGANNAVFIISNFDKWSRSILMILRSIEKTIFDSFSKKILSHQFKFYYTKSDAFNSFQWNKSDETASGPPDGFIFLSGLQNPKPLLSTKMRCFLFFSVLNLKILLWQVGVISLWDVADCLLIMSKCEK